ncbi:GspH/FimT family pseudopilin [Chromobacterium piscinae]|uniref:GspH/FimT family pseudopilin n=1 Tax=Chromobacterium piscinae TaxID=686831 RepID=UPI0032096B44
MDKQQAFTLPELLIVMAMLAIVLAFAVPAYQSAVSANAVMSESNNLYGDILSARNEALKRGQTVLVCPSADGANCNASSPGNTNWAGGWIVLQAAGGNCTDTSGAVLRRQQAFSSGDSASSNNSAYPYLCFNRMGYAPSSNDGMVTFNTPGNQASSRRCVALAAVGHPQVMTNGQTDSTGQYTCQ